MAGVSLFAYVCVFACMASSQMAQKHTMQTHIHTASGRQDTNAQEKCNAVLTKTYWKLVLMRNLYLFYYNNWTLATWHRSSQQYEPMHFEHMYMHHMLLPTKSHSRKYIDWLQPFWHSAFRRYALFDSRFHVLFFLFWIWPIVASTNSWIEIHVCMHAET